MRRFPHPRPLSIAAALAAAACLAASALLGLSAQTATERRFEYPKAERGEQVDDYHGIKVADPYRWLEDTDSEKTVAWVKAENDLTFRYLEGIPQREAIRRRLTKLWDYERYGIPEKEGGLYFFEKNDGLQNQSVLYTMKSLDDKPRILLDPNKLSEDGTVAVTGTSVSPDGKLMAYALSASGSDWRDYRVLDLATGENLPDHLRWAKFSDASWSRDSAGFYYSRYDEPDDNILTGANYYHKLYYHRLGTPQSEDRLIYERKDRKEWGFNGEATEDGRYLVIHVWQGTDERNRVFYKDLEKERAGIVELLDDFDATYIYLGNEGPVFWFRTDLEAPRGRVIGIDITQPGRDSWKTIVPESDSVLIEANVVNDKFVCSYLKDARSRVKVFGLDGTFIREVELPGIGFASGFGGHRQDRETFYSFSSFNLPTTIFRHDLEAGKSSVFRRPEIDFDPDDYETRQVFYESKDGTKVPMFITGRKGYALDGTHPAYLYGYGGFNIPMTPRFSVTNLVWMEMGGLYAQASLRGGGEYGKDWHEAGMKLKKQNVFDDFIAAAEYLIDNKYTSRERLAIGGGSNGGLLVGAVLNQRPDLFGAALPAVGVMDMLRFDKFTIGHAWVSDYGSAENPEEFHALRAYSPLHNIKKGASYPATMITTADHDDRVVPGHSFKYAAALQKAQEGDAPILIRIETKAGHGAGKPTSKRIEEAADRWSFLVHELGFDPRLPPQPRQEVSGGR